MTRRIALILFLTTLLTAAAVVTSPGNYSDDQQPLNPGANTVPAFPVVQSPSASNTSSAQATCRLDLSAELFGGVGDACVRGGPLDRGRCCPVLAAWLFAAHARSALEISPNASSDPAADLSSGLPMMPDDSQKCVDSLQASLASRKISLPRPNATCDTVLCFCGIRLHQIGSLSCPAAFNVSSSGAGGPHRNATPTAAVRALERDCRNSSYSGCTRCLDSLQKLKGGGGAAKGSERAARMFDRDCQLMGLTWLLAKNKTEYIPTVSAVLRALLYSPHPPTSPAKQRCSPDQANMPLAVDSLQFQKAESSSAPSRFAPNFTLFYLCVLLLVFLVG